MVKPLELFITSPSETLYYIHQIFLQGLQVRMEKWPVLVLGTVISN